MSTTDSTESTGYTLKEALAVIQGDRNFMAMLSNDATISLFCRESLEMRVAALDRYIDEVIGSTE